MLHASPLLPRLFDIIRKALSAHPGGLPLVNLAARLNNEVGAYWYQPLGFKKLLNALYALNNLSPSPLLTLQPTGAGDYLALPPPPVILPPAPAAPAPLANPSLTDAPPQPSAEEATALLWGFLSHGAYAKLPHIHQKLCERYPHFSYKALGYSKLHIYLSSLSALDLDLSTPNQARLRSPSAPASLLSGS
ncbi:MAG: hypothetical protein FJ138_14490 [Deltaproteobacteria bacterium]|nr:hypothetical protein [Deltaproteobacteria bacterium]